MVWGDKPIDTTATTRFDRLDATMAFAVVGDEDLADMGPTQTLADRPPAKHPHRKPRRGLTVLQTGAAAVFLGGVAFAAVWALSDSQAPASGVVRQAAPDAPVVPASPSPRPTVKRPVVRPAEPVVRRQDRPAPVNPVHTVVVTVTAKPKATATPTPKPTASSPKPTATPETTLPGPVETGEPDVDPTPATEVPDGDN